MKVYKIRHKVTGLYSKGGGYNSWSKQGKIWTTKGALKNHLKLRNDLDDKNITKNIDWEIVEFELTETGKFGAFDLI